MIVMENISKVYSQGDKKITALQDAAIAVQQGEIFGVIGYSGAGKSTLLRCINMLERPTAGSVKINGVEMTDLNGAQLQQARRKIGMIFQHFNLLSSSTVFMNVAAPLHLINAPRKVIEQKVGQLLELVGLSAQANAYPAQLSGGQKQRVGIARALASDPEILLCDEATSALDPETTDSILDLLLNINRQMKLTIVLVTHEMNVIKKICDRVAVMENGRVIEQGKVIDLFVNPQTHTTRRFVSTIIDTRVPGNVLESIQKSGISGIVARISYVGNAETGLFLTERAAKFRIQSSVIFGSIAEVKQTICGNLVVCLEGPRDKIQKLLQELENGGIHTEIVLDCSQPDFYPVAGLG